MSIGILVLFLVGLVVWGICVPLILLDRLRKAQREAMHLQTELKNILFMLKESKNHKNNTQYEIETSKKMVREHLFASPKYM
jgi:hypothetical protein